MRDSLKDEIDDRDIFHKSRTFIDWYCETLNVQFPFSKLDHIFIPDLHCTTMENVGGITYDDKFVQKNLNPLDHDYFNMIMAKEM